MNYHLFVISSEINTRTLRISNNAWISDSRQQTELRRESRSTECHNVKNKQTFMIQILNGRYSLAIILLITVKVLLDDRSNARLTWISTIKDFFFTFYIPICNLNTQNMLAMAKELLAGIFTHKIHQKFRT